jgi:hypothetical protein
VTDLAESMTDTGDSSGETIRYHGKYRGTVTINIDPEQRGRLIATVPDVLGLAPSTWALPCAPMAGASHGVFMVPQIGAKVWIEFEQGDPDFPIWVGGFWGSRAEVPILALEPPIPPGQNIVLQTMLQCSVQLSDGIPTPATGGIVLRSSPTGAMIVVNETGIYLNNGKGAVITMIGPTVDINNTGLTVT